MPVQRTTSENQHMHTATLKSGEVLHQSRYFLVRQKDREGVLDQGVNETMTHEANVPSSNPAEEEIHYPLTTEDRGAYKTRAGKVRPMASIYDHLPVSFSILATHATSVGCV